MFLNTIRRNVEIKENTSVNDSNNNKKIFDENTNKIKNTGNNKASNDKLDMKANNTKNNNNTKNINNVHINTNNNTININKEEIITNKETIQNKLNIAKKEKENKNLKEKSSEKDNELGNNGNNIINEVNNDNHNNSNNSDNSDSDDIVINTNQTVKPIANTINNNNNTNNKDPNIKGTNKDTYKDTNIQNNHNPNNNINPLLNIKSIEVSPENYKQYSKDLIKKFNPDSTERKYFKFSIVKTNQNNHNYKNELPLNNFITDNDSTLLNMLCDKKINNCSFILYLNTKGNNLLTSLNTTKTYCNIGENYLVSLILANIAYYCFNGKSKTSKSSTNDVLINNPVIMYLNSLHKFFSDLDCDEYKNEKVKIYKTTFLYIFMYFITLVKNVFSKSYTKYSSHTKQKLSNKPTKENNLKDSKEYCYIYTIKLFLFIYQESFIVQRYLNIISYNLLINFYFANGVNINEKINKTNKINDKAIKTLLKEDRHLLVLISNLMYTMEINYDVIDLQFILGEKEIKEIENFKTYFKENIHCSDFKNNTKPIFNEMLNSNGNIEFNEYYRENEYLSLVEFMDVNEDTKNDDSF